LLERFIAYEEQRVSHEYEYEGEDDSREHPQKRSRQKVFSSPRIKKKMMKEIERKRHVIFPTRLLSSCGCS
jgi:hypothetical protein